MGHSDLDPAIHDRRAWNAGQNVGPKRPLKPRDIWAIRFYLDEHRRPRDRALFDLAIDSKLRGCDLVKIRIGDLMSAGSFRDRATVIQQKTGRPVQFGIENTVRYLGVHIDDALTLSERTEIGKFRLPEISGKPVHPYERPAGINE
jgi:hypothetical protein